MDDDVTSQEPSHCKRREAERGVKGLKAPCGVQGQRPCEKPLWMRKHPQNHPT